MRGSPYRRPGDLRLTCALCVWRPADGKYLVLPSGELHIRSVSSEDGFKSYKCRTVHRLTQETRLSATAGRLVISGRSCEALEGGGKDGARRGSGGQGPPKKLEKGRVG